MAEKIVKLPYAGREIMEREDREVLWSPTGDRESTLYGEWTLSGDPVLGLPTKYERRLPAIGVDVTVNADSGLVELWCYSSTSSISNEFIRSMADESIFYGFLSDQETVEELERLFDEALK